MPKKILQRWIRIVPYGKNGAVRKYFVTAQVCKNRVARRGLTQSFKPQEKLKYLKGDKMWSEIHLRREIFTSTWKCLLVKTKDSLSFLWNITHRLEVPVATDYPISKWPWLKISHWNCVKNESKIFLRVGGISTQGRTETMQKIVIPEWVINYKIF